jgi:hypothetical protein
MSDAASALQPAIDVLEQDLADLERQANGLLTSINVLRIRAGLPPRPGAWSSGSGGSSGKDHSPSGPAVMSLHSDTFTGKKLGSAVREYLTMRKASGQDAPATSREIFDALKLGGFVSGAKDDATSLVVLRTMLRKNTVMFAKLQNGKYGLRAWYPNLKQPKGAPSAEGADEAATEDPNVIHMPDESSPQADAA